MTDFARLVNTASQHTTVETENVRFVYQPLEELYMVLITNRDSNILSDLRSLHLFAQVVTGSCRTCNEAEIIRNAFELIFAFDEICTLGYCENLSLPQIKNFLEMDSHEEKIQEIIEKNKELEANEERKRRAKQLEQQRKELARRGFSQSGSGSMHSGGYTPVSSRPTYSEPVAQPAFESKLTKAASAPRGKGMSLGKKSKQADLFEAVRGEAEPAPLLQPSVPTFEEEPVQPQRAIDTEAVHVKLTESLTAKANRDGGILAGSMELKGDLTLLISDREQGKIEVQCDLDNAIPGIQMKTHPNVDKTKWSSNSTVALRDASKSFPIDHPIGVVRWSLKSAPSDFDFPIVVTCWTDMEGGQCQVSLEYEYSGSSALSDVVIRIPLLNDQDPQIGDPSDETSLVTVNQATSNLEWSIPSISEDNSSGTLGFSCAADDADEFFPVTVTYATTTPLCGLDVALVIAADEAAGVIQFSKEVSVTGTISIQST